MLDGKKIKRLRLAQDLTLEQAAVAAGMSHRQAWHRLESGVRKSVSLETLAAIAKALKCSPGELLKSKRR